MNVWQTLGVELDRWADSGREATLWWRDDDAIAVTKDLERLTRLAATHGVGICAAVIPAHVSQELLDYRWPEGSAIIQHGFAHENHAPDDRKKSEFPAERPLQEIQIDLSAGWSAINTSISAIAAFVPPWNRIGEAAMRALSAAGLFAVSTFGPRRSANPHPGLRQINTHVDPINWRGDRGYVGDDQVIHQLVSHLESRRTGTVDTSEPTGILTHHLVHDEECWYFAERLAAFIAGHQGGKWVTSDEVFAR